MTPEAIRAARLALGLSQEQLAAELGTTSTTVSRWERGQSTPPRALALELRDLARRMRRRPGRRAP